MWNHIVGFWVVFWPLRSRSKQCAQLLWSCDPYSLKLTTFFSQRWKKNCNCQVIWMISLYFNFDSRVEISMLNGENFTFSEEEIYKIFVRKRSNKIWRVELCGIILLGSEWFLENDGIHSCEISYCPGIEIFVHKYCSRVVPRTEKKMIIKQLVYWAVYCWQWNFVSLIIGSSRAKCNKVNQHLNKFW